MSERKESGVKERECVKGGERVRKERERGERGWVGGWVKRGGIGRVKARVGGGGEETHLDVGRGRGIYILHTGHYTHYTHHTTRTTLDAP
jgi:hypothetical protein